jgi:hypothetical protein
MSLLKQQQKEDRSKQLHKLRHTQAKAGVHRSKQLHKLRRTQAKAYAHTNKLYYYILRKETGSEISSR